MAGEIEFLEPDPAPDGDPRAHAPRPHREPPRSHRARTAAIVVVAVLVAAAFVIRIATSGSDTSAARRTPDVPPSPPTSITLDPSTGNIIGQGFDVYCDAIPVDVPIEIPNRISPSPQVSATAGSPTTGRRTGATRPGRPTASASCTADPTPCPQAGDGLSACTSTSALPSAFGLAVRSAFPGAVVSRASTQITRETRLIWYRGVTMRVGRSTAVTVVVEQPGSDPGPEGTVDNGSQVISRAVSRTKNNYVIVVVTTPSGTRQDYGSALKLATDDRLSAVD